MGNEEKGWEPLILVVGWGAIIIILIHSNAKMRALDFSAVSKAVARLQKESFLLQFRCSIETTLGSNSISLVENNALVFHLSHWASGVQRSRIRILKTG